MKVDIEANPDNLAAYQRYIGGPGVGVPAVAFVDYEGNLINKPPLHLAFEPEQFAGMMENTLEVEEDFQRLRRGIKKNPSDPEMNAELALIYLQRGNFEKGLPLADKTFALDPKNKTGRLPALHINLGLYYGDHIDGENGQDYFQKAETHFRTVIQKYTKSEDYEPAHYYLGVAYAIQEKYDQAIATLEKLRDAKDPDTRAVAMQVLEQIKARAAEPE